MNPVRIVSSTPVPIRRAIIEPPHTYPFTARSNAIRLSIWGVELTDAQREQIRAIMDEHRENAPGQKMQRSTISSGATRERS